MTQALIKYEPPRPPAEGWRERLRREFQAAIARGDLADPITGTIFTMATLKALAISAAVSGATALFAAAVAPKPEPQEQGRLSGELLIQNSEQGVMIPEVFGAGPSTTLTPGSAPNWQNVQNMTAGGGGSLTKSGGGSSWNAGATHATQINAGDNVRFKFTVGSGYAAAGFFTIANPVNSDVGNKVDIQWNPDGTVSLKYNAGTTVAGIAHWVAGDVFYWELRDGRFRLFKGSQEITGDTWALPAPVYPLWAGVVAQNVGAGVSASDILIGDIGAAPNAGLGGIKLPPQIVWTSKIRKHVTVSQTRAGKGFLGGKTVETKTVTYDVDLLLMFARGNGGLSLARLYANTDIIYRRAATEATGVVDGTVGGDDSYDPALPPATQSAYTKSFQRASGALQVAGDGSSTGTVVAGAGAGLAVYPGNSTQLPDPTYQAATDARYGLHSTPAMRGRACVGQSQFDLSRWNGALPNWQGVWEHLTLITLEQICGHWCGRVALQASNVWGFDDFSFSALADTKCRGLGLVGRRYAPLEAMDQLARFYHVFFATIDGVVTGKPRGQAVVATLDDSELGWVPAEADNDGMEDRRGVVPELDTMLANPLTVTRRVDVKFFDPNREWEPNVQGDVRQTGVSQQEEVLDFAICALPEEARESAQRELYERAINSTKHSFLLPWTYLWLNPGDEIEVVRDEGFTHRIRLLTIKGGIGILECEGEAADASVYTQPTRASLWTPGGGVIFPGMVIGGFIDVALREADVNRPGFYVYAVMRTGSGSGWLGAGMYRDDGDGNYDLQALIPAQAVIGVMVGTLPLDATQIDVDLYGDEAALESVTDEQLDRGLNAVLIGEEVLQVGTWTKQSGYPNRWRGTGTIRRGLVHTEDFIGTHVANERFALANDALVFVDQASSSQGVGHQYRFVPLNGSVDDAPVLTYTWYARILRPPRVIDLVGARSAGQASATWMTAAPNRFLPESYVVRVKDVSTGAVMRTVTLQRPLPTPAVWTLYQNTGGNPALVSINVDGSIRTTVAPTGFLSYLSQVFTGDADIIWEVDDRPCPWVGIWPAVAGPGMVAFLQYGYPGYSNPRYVVAELLVLLKRYLPAGATVEMRVRNGHVDYVVNGVLFAHGYGEPITWPWQVIVYFDGDLAEAQGYLRTRVAAFSPRQFLYTTEMAQEDFGASPPATVRIEVAQVYLGVEGPARSIVI